MASPVVEELVNAARRELTIKSAADRLVNTARPLLRRAMEERASAAEAKARAASPATKAPTSSSEPTQLDLVVPQQGVAEDSLQSLRSGPIVPQPQLQQQQRTWVGMQGVTNRNLLLGDNQEEVGRMNAALDEIEQVQGNVTQDMALDIRNRLGVDVPPANPMPRLEVSDENLQFRQDFLDIGLRENEEAKGTLKHFDYAPGGGPLLHGDITQRYTTGYKLGDMIDDSWEVFRYYPSLKDLNIKALPMFSFNTLGSYDRATKTMRLPSSYHSASQLEDVRSTVAHEVQHYIQDVEQWARGGNTNEFKDLFKGKYESFAKRKEALTAKHKGAMDRVLGLDEAKAFKSYYAQAKSLPKIKGQFFDRDSATTDAFKHLGYNSDEALARFLSDDIEDIRSAFRKEYRHLKRVSNILPENYADDFAIAASKILDLKRQLDQYTSIRELVRLTGKLKKLDGINEIAYKGYQNLFGEVEARATQARLGMSDAERRAEVPETVMTKPEETIVRQQDQELKGNIVPGISFEQGHIVFHGGPVSAIDKFLLKFIGTGEGGIMRGWGFYFAERPGISATYRAARASDKEEIRNLSKTFELSDYWAKMSIKKDIRKFFGVGDSATKTSIQSSWDLKDELDFSAKQKYAQLIDIWSPKHITRDLLEETALAVWNSAFLKQFNDLVSQRSVIFWDKKLDLTDPDLQIKLAEIDGQLDNLSALENSSIAKNAFVKELTEAYSLNLAQPEQFKLAEDAGLFVLDIKANPDLDYIHLDKTFKDQSKKVKAALNGIFGGVHNLTFMNPTDSAEGFIKHLERSFNSIGDLVNDPSIPLKEQRSRLGGVIGLNPTHLERFKKVYRLTLDTTSEEFSRARIDRKFASLVMKEFGIPGSAHWDAMSRDGRPIKDRTNNFVIWDEDIIEQLAVQPHSWEHRGKLEVDPADHPPTDEYKPK